MPRLASSGSAHALGALRVVTGFLFACHGAAKLFGALGGDRVPMGQWPYWWAGIVELGGGALVAVGLLTRPSALLCSGTMAYAYFTEHQPRAVFPLQNDGELAALYCWLFLGLAATAPAKLSLSGLRTRQAKTADARTLPPEAASVNGSPSPEAQ